MTKNKVEKSVLTPPDISDLQVLDFLHESNLIESIDSYDALDDAVEAWNYAYEHRDKIDLKYILGIHRLLIKRLEPEIAGKWRNCDVWIGGERKMFVSEALIKSQVQTWLDDCKITKKILALTNWEKEELIRKWHVAFERIHPFSDGNGRTGRILMNVQRCLLGLPWLIIDHRTRADEYYPWFRD
jgi:hypothetical protein